MAKEMVDFKKIEKRWQAAWEKAKIFAVKPSKRKKFYCLEMFPYPSASGLHIGHAFNYTIGDIYARFKRMNGFNVLYPIGYDSFGLPAENAAIKAKVHPKIFTENAIKNFIKQQKSLGWSYDWNRIIITHTPEYYKWDQYFFLLFLGKDLIYRKKAPVNYCPKCKTVLANEQVHEGKCWRHKDTEIEIKQLEQWFIRTTKYAEELLKDLDKLKWPERIKIMQRNWIGKSYGTDITFKINNEGWKIFTTRPDTIYGVTFMVISAQHPQLMKLVSKDKEKEVKEFLKKLKTTSQEELEKLDKEGIFIGCHAINPLTNEKVPVYVGNFVLAEYGSGMVMAVPAHDQRDFEFAKKYKLPIKIVIQPEGKKLEPAKMKEAYEGEGILVNSGKFSGIRSDEAREKISEHVKKHNLGKRAIQYKLKDWLISRQRYWGTPIPVVYCEKCGIIHIPEKDLPVLLPEKVKFGEGNPLETNKDFVNTKCPKCKGKARRETDTLDTFFESSWYFLRYLDSKNDKKPFDKKKAEYWMPVDQYIGGEEHACMHLIYARFFTKALRDLGFVKIDEPFTRLFNQGMLHGSDGYVMSKSRGNVVLPEEVSKKYGIDTARLFLTSIASPNKDIIWSEKGIEGSLRFIKKVFDYFIDIKIGKSSKKVESKFNKTVKEATSDIDSFRYNLAVIKIRELFDYFSKEENKEVLGGFLKLLSPFCPHISEELWHKLGNKTFISLEKWPVADESKIKEKFEKEEEAEEKLREDVRNIIKILKKKPKKIIIYALPKEKSIYEEAEEKIKEEFEAEVKIFSVADKSKYDPEGKASKAKPGKPAIYVE